MDRLYGALGIIAIIGLCWWRYESVVSDRDDLQNKLTKSQGEVAGYKEKVAELKAIEAADKKVIADYHAKKDQVVYVDRQVQKEVIKYRDIVVDRFTINPEWVHAYNLSITSEAGKEGSSGGTNDTPAGTKRIVSDAEALDTITANNRACVNNSTQLLSLQQWVLTL